MKFTSFSKSHVQESDLGYYDTDIPTNRDWIPRGNGNSYSNSAQIDNGLVIKSSGSKIFRISPDLSNVICSSNVTIGELLLYLAKYNREKELAGKNYMLTESQKKWVKNRLDIIYASPIIKMQMPANEWKQPFFYIAENKFVQNFIFFCIVVNTVILSLSWYG